MAFILHSESNLPLPLSEDPSVYRTYNDVSAPPSSFPAGLLNPTLGRALAYWTSLAGGALPRRAQLSPAQMVPFLKHVILWDYLPDTDRFVCRLAGTEICEAAGRELRGRTVEEMHGDGSAAVRVNFETVIETGHANFVHRRMSWIDRSYRSYERLLLPLADEAGEIRHLMGVMTVDWA